MKKYIALAAASAVIVASFSVSAFAQTTSSAGSSSSAMRHPKMTINTSCMGAAVTARDTAISTALQTLATAIQTRGTAMSAAWNDSTASQRQTDLKAATAAFNGSWKTFYAARHNAWVQYRTAIKACKVSPSDANATGTPQDATGDM